MLTFSERELRHIALSVGALAVAVSGIGPNWRGATVVGRNLISVSLPLAVGFFAHEMAHKTVAGRYGYRSYYQMWPQGLIIALLIGIASSGRFLFAAPGAVMIQATYATQEENGLISIAGPLTNLGVAALFCPLLSLHGILAYVGYFGVLINLWLALFNFMPIPPLDGSKVFHWKPKLGIGMLILTGFLVFFIL